MTRMTKKLKLLTSSILLLLVLTACFGLMIMPQSHTEKIVWQDGVTTIRDNGRNFLICQKSGSSGLCLNIGNSYKVVSSQQNSAVVVWIGQSKKAVLHITRMQTTEEDLIQTWQDFVFLDLAAADLKITLVAKNQILVSKSGKPQELPNCNVWYKLTRSGIKITKSQCKKHKNEPFSLLPNKR